MSELPLQRLCRCCAVLCAVCVHVHAAKGGKCVFECVCVCVCVCERERERERRGERLDMRSCTGVPHS